MSCTIDDDVLGMHWYRQLTINPDGVLRATATERGSQTGVGIAVQFSRKDRQLADNAAHQRHSGPHCRAAGDGSRHQMRPTLSG